ncbi:MAG: Na+/H+ antiporter NhaC family protein [Paludibacter sp.]|nr:Na+/H+ antiporter NhaC family protein [Paludibacter sp.]
MTNQHKLPHPLVALLPIVVLVLLVATAVYLFGGDALNGGSQMALLLATAFCLIIGKFTTNFHWTNFEKALHKNIKNISTALLILLVIGALSGTWMMSGVVPMFIDYGLKIIRPEIFLISAAAICAIVSVVTGSSWTTVATIGIALMGIGRAQGFSDGWIAGAIISGAYFGDKISPLSDTTILASSVSGTPLFTHIRYMMFTTVPSMIITLIVFAIAGLFNTSISSADVTLYSQSLETHFNISPWLLIVPAVTIVLIAKRVPPLVTLFSSMLLAAIFACFFQKENLQLIAGGNTTADLVKGAIMSCYGSTSLDTGNPEINSLIATRGMQGMLYTVWLIICATCFGAAMSATGMIESITQFLVKKIRNTAGLVGATVSTGLLANLTMGDQYLSLILTGNMYKDLYEQRGYESRLLSRSMEDSATVTSVLIPWNSCGMTQSTVLGVSTWVYFPYCIFNYISPLMSITIAGLGYKIFRKKPEVQ